MVHRQLAVALFIEEEVRRRGRKQREGEEAKGLLRGST